MKKEFYISILILLGFVSFLWLEKPLRECLDTLLLNKQLAKNISGATVRIILIVLVFSMIRSFKLIHFTGLDSWRNLKNIQAAAIPFAIVAMGIMGNWNTYLSSEFSILLFFAISTFTVGVVEELTFRGTVFPLLIKSFAHSKRPILISGIVSSLMFGAIHFINLYSQPGNLIGITSQVFFATSIGVFFCGLLVRTENILVPAIIHAMVNFGFGAGELKEVIEKTEVVNTIDAVNWNSIIPTTVFFLFIFIGGIYMINKADKKAIKGKLKLE